MHIYAFADEASKSLSGQITAMRRNGLNGVEIRGTDGINVSALTPEKAAEIKKALDDNGLTVWSLGSPLGKIALDDDFDAHLEKLKHTIEIAHILGTPNIRMFSFYPAKNQNITSCQNQVMDRLSSFVETAKGTGCILCHENEKGIYGDNAARCLEILNTFPEIACVFDPCNFIQCGQDTLEAWNMLKDRVYYLHIKDGMPDGSVVPAGRGCGHLREILTDYALRGGQNITVEPHLTVFDGFSSLEKVDEKSVIHPYTYASSDEAFDAACAAVKSLL